MTETTLLEQGDIRENFHTLGPDYLFSQTNKPFIVKYNKTVLKRIFNTHTIYKSPKKTVFYTLRLLFYMEYPNKRTDFIGNNNCFFLYDNQTP